MWPFKKKFKKPSHEILDREDKELLSKEEILKENEELKKEEGTVKKSFKKGLKK